MGRIYIVKRGSFSMSAFYDNEEKSETSKYNDGYLSIQRLNQIWVMCRHYIKNGKFQAWKTELDNVWLELYPDIIRQTDSEGVIRKNTYLRLKVAKAKKMGKDYLFFDLMKRHEFLRVLQDQAGKAGVYIDENEEAFE